MVESGVEYHLSSEIFIDRFHPVADMQFFINW